MKKSVISTLLAELEQLVQVELETGVEFWLARDLQGVLGYTNWQNFRKVISDAVTACESSGNKASDHFTEVSKMIVLGKGGRRSVEDFMLTRYACYLIAQNGDSKLPTLATFQLGWNSARSSRRSRSFKNFGTIMNSSPLSSSLESCFSKS